MKYLIELKDGSKVECNELVEQDVMVCAIVVNKPKWWQFFNRKCTNDLYTFKYKHIKGVWIKGLTDDEMVVHLESIDAAMRDTKKNVCDCDDCGDCDEVDPEEIPNSYFEFAPVNPNMYG